MERLRLACIQIFRGIDRDSGGALSLDELGPFMRRTLGMDVSDGVVRSVAEWLIQTAKARSLSTSCETRCTF